MDERNYAYFLKRLREARYIVLEDAENFTDICFVLEEIGTLLGQKKQNGLFFYKNSLLKLVGTQKLKKESFEAYFDKLFHARNDKSHQGVYARNAAQYAVKVSIILEDCLMSKLTELRHIMVDNVIFAEEYMTLAKIRELMLRYSFSYLPYRKNGKYYLLSDFDIAKLWNQAKSDTEKYVNSISNLINDDILQEKTMKLHPFNTKLDKFPVPEQPILIYENDKKNIVGILTPFDFL